MVNQRECAAFLSEGTVIEDVKKKHFRIIPIIDEEIYMDVINAYYKDQPLSPAANAISRAFFKKRISKNEYSYIERPQALK